MFIPTSKQEINKLGWHKLDIILVSGDAYIDVPYDGVAVIGKVLINAGYKVGIISQPALNSHEDIMRLGEPDLFWGISAGCTDSMVANYTALKKRKRNDDLTPGGINNKRPDRALLAYTNLIRRFFKNTKPIILGGIEASLRRIAHYDYWDDKIRRSILFDSKADAIVYGMGEKTILEIAECLKTFSDFRSTRGICYISNSPNNDYLLLPSFEEVQNDDKKFIEMFHTFYKNNDPLNAKGLYQQHGTRYLIQNPPNYFLATEELDKVNEIGFERDVHPYYKKQGKVKALETIQFSVNSHRGCFGECNFCSITVHQGRTVISRSIESIKNEIKEITKHKDFKGIISDVGGPTANMYDMTCEIQSSKGSCKNKRCIAQKSCDKLIINHEPQIELLKELSTIPGIKKIFIGSGIRYDLVMEDSESGIKFLSQIVDKHVSGQLKIAPEHIDDSILKLMGKPPSKHLKNFKDKFYELSKVKNKKQFLTYYFIAAHPGCDIDNMKSLNYFVKNELKLSPEQVQIFTPTPSTYSTLMYYTGLNPFTNEQIFVEKDSHKKEIQKKLISGKNN
ncbi:MAG: YgiQ family radical SAM protein [FCB group bacterium]|jgi:uncharacterized radical SAM protein YgiQ